MRTDWMEAPDGLERIPGGSVASPPGFAAAGVSYGSKRDGAPDLGLLHCRAPAVSALVDTRNALPSAPVVRNRAFDAAGFRAVVVNAGNANAGTGPGGIRDAERMAVRAAERLGLEPDEVAVSSTGVIGERLAIDRLLAGIESAAALLGPGGGEAFARAICTTDRLPKAGAFRLERASGPVTIGAAAKGAGMLSPHMATMLAYLTTDAAITPADLAALTRAAAERSFNRISVDGQMSPSDTLLVIANGTGPPLAGEDLARFGAALTAICRWLAVQMVRDGEGAEHAVRLLVSGAGDAAEAQAVARAVGDSPLVKAAAFGRDPNFGRISQAVGQALAGRGGPPADLRAALDGVPVDDPGAAAVLERDEYELRVDLGRGSAAAELFFSDLTHAYVTLNADYHT